MGGVEYWIFEEPQTVPNKPLPENAAQINTNKTNTDELNTKESSTDGIKRYCRHRYGQYDNALLF